MKCERVKVTMEDIKVKEEPVDLPENVETDVPANKSNDCGGPEFINIKAEIDVPNSDIRVKPEDAATLENAAKTWLVPIQNTAIADCTVDVEVKVEPEDYYTPEDENESLSEGPTSSHVYEGARITQRQTGTLCHICHKSFANPSNVQRHMLLHLEKNFHCTECPKRFLTQILLDQHMDAHKYVKPKKTHDCELCNKSFKTSSNLMQHKRTHMDVKPFFCTQCHRSFAFKANLTKHQGKSRCKRPIDEPIQCHVCNKTFDKEFLLKSHLRRHETERPFACEQCSMKFKYKSTLIRHMHLHEGVKPHACPVCDKTFTHLGLLKPHMRVHTGEKPYQCQICQKCFAHKHNMQRHAIRHNKIKHLVCDVCHKKFPKESRLKYHMKIHVNEKHFACQVCPKRFSHKQNVLRHYTRKHPNAKYECSETDASVALKVWDSIKGKYSEEPEEILG